MLNCRKMFCPQWNPDKEHNCKNWQPTVTCGFVPEEYAKVETYGACESVGCDACIDNLCHDKGTMDCESRTSSVASLLKEAFGGSVSPVQRRVQEAQDRLAEIFEGKPTHPEVTTASRLARICDETKALLLEKNKAYGDSASSPIGVFSNGTPLESICVRIDDKLNRIMKGSEYPGDDTIQDLIGYLILYRAVKEEQDEV